MDLRHLQMAVRISETKKPTGLPLVAKWPLVFHASQLFTKRSEHAPLTNLHVRKQERKF